MSQNAVKRADRLARGLGWFSVGLGLTQLLVPRGLARTIGVGDHRRSRTTMRALGVRELAAGLGLLSQPRRAPWLWARVAGDAIDIGLLVKAYGARRAEPARITSTLAAVLGVTALDVLAGREASRIERTGARAARHQPVRVLKAITIDRPIEEVYAFWRNFENLPRFMANLESVKVLDQRRSHWRAKAPAGRSVEWDAEIVDDVPNERIAWRSTGGTNVPNRGEVRFLRSPGGKGTIVRVQVQFDPPGGALGASLAGLIRKIPEVQVGNDLHRLKQVLEVGEVIHSDASIASGPHPARPSPRS